mgnify:CR=1 FL=1
MFQGRDNQILLLRVLAGEKRACSFFKLFRGICRIGVGQDTEDISFDLVVSLSCFKLVGTVDIAFDDTIVDINL